MQLWKWSYYVVFSIAFFVTSSAFACTGLQVKAIDGTFVNGRTVEFGISLDLTGLVVPRGYTFKGTLPNGNIGLIYQSKYAVIGMNAFGSPAILDGVNEKGLAAGAFYFPGYAGYATITKENSNRALAPTEFVNWVLTQFASVEEVKQSLQAVVIAPTPMKDWGGVPPFHFIVYDRAGKSVVIEPVNGELRLYDNAIGVITNSPTFDWHMTNLSNYLNLTPMNIPSKEIDGVALKQFGQGSGLHGLPGDFTPPSRFIRAAIFSNTAIPVESTSEAVLQVFHLLNQFDIPNGAVRAQEGNKIATDITIVTTVKDTQHSKYYFKTYHDQGIKLMNLKSFDVNAKKLKTITIKGNTVVIDISANAKEAILASLH